MTQSGDPDPKRSERMPTKIPPATRTPLAANTLTQTAGGAA